MFNIVVNNPEETTMTNNDSVSVNSVQVKRQVVVKTLVNDDFRQRAKSELNEEHKMIDAQLQQLEAQYQHTMNQLESLAGQGENVQRQLEQVSADFQKKRSQLSSVKMQVSSQMANLDKIANGQYVITGQLEDNVTLNVGDNLYAMAQGVEMLVEDGIIKGFRPLQ